MNLNHSEVKYSVNLRLLFTGQLVKDIQINPFAPNSPFHPNSLRTSETHKLF